MLSAYLTLFGKIPVFLLVTLAACAVVGGDYAAKAWSVNHSNAFLILAFFGYFLSAFFYIPTLLRESLLVTGIVWGVISTVGFYIVALVIFREKITHMQMIAAGLGTVSIFLLTL